MDFFSILGKSYDVFTQVLDRLRSVKLTAKPSKCMFAYGSIECLCHNIVGQSIRTQEGKLQAIRDAVRPNHQETGQIIHWVSGVLPQVYTELLDHCFSFNGFNKER